MKLGTFLHITTESQQGWKKQIKLFKTLKGLNSVEIWLEALDVAERNIAELQKITSGLKKVVHAPFMNLSLISCHHEVNQASISILRKAAEISKLIGVKLITCHAGAYPAFYSKNDALETFVKNWSKLVFDRNFFALENISPKSNTTISFPTDIVSLRTIKKLLPELKITLDIGHLIQANESLESIEGLFIDYGKDIINIHLHDAITGKNGHLPLGSGDLKLNWFFELLKKYNYNGYINLEALNNDDVLNSWSKIVSFI